MNFPAITASVADVTDFIQCMGFAELAQKMPEDEIDGDALYLLEVADLVDYGLKKGPALKLHRSLQENKPQEHPGSAFGGPREPAVSLAEAAPEAVGSVLEVQWKHLQREFGSTSGAPWERLGSVPEEPQGVEIAWRNEPEEACDEPTEVDDEPAQVDDKSPEVGDESTNGGDDLGVTVAEFEAIISALGFSYQEGFAHTKLQDCVLKDLAWCLFKDPCNGCNLSSGIKIFMSQDLNFTIDVNFTVKSQVTLTSGAHRHQNLLQASGITQEAEVFLSHWQGDAVADTLDGAKDYVRRHGSSHTRFWLDFVSLNHNKINCYSEPDCIKATIVRPSTLAVSMSPWHGAHTLTRIWCCLEVGLHVNAGQDVIIVMTASEKRDFMDILEKDYSSIMNRIYKVDVSKGEASRAADKEWALQELQDESGSCQAMNEQIVSTAFSALIAYAKQAVKELDSKSNTKTALYCNNLGLLLHDSGDLAGAEPLFRRALAIAKEMLGMEHPEVAEFCNNLGILLEDCGDLSGAELRYRQALAISEKALGIEHPTVATRCSNLGMLLEVRGDLAGAEPLCRRALDIDEKVLGMDHPDVAIRCSNLGLLLQARGDLIEAEPFLRRALAISEKAFGLEHPDVATDCNNLGMLLQSLGNLAGAETLYRTVLAIDEKVMGMEHPQIATDCNNLGTLLQARGEMEAVEPLLRRALAIDEKAFGMEHPDVATDCNNLGLLLEDNGDLTGAEQLYRRALAIGEKAHGVEHPNVAIYCNNLSMLLLARGDTAEAEPLCRRALAIDEKVLGVEHENVALRCTNLGRLLQAHGDLLGAEPLLRRALDITEKALGAEHLNVAVRCNSLGMLLEAQGNLTGAETLYCRAVAINGKALGVEHPRIAMGCNNLGLQLQATPGSAWEAVPRSARGLRGKAVGVERQPSGGVERQSSRGVDRQVSLGHAREFVGVAPGSARAGPGVERQVSQEFARDIGGIAAGSAELGMAAERQVSLGLVRDIGAGSLGSAQIALEVEKQVPFRELGGLGDEQQMSLGRSGLGDDLQASLGLSSLRDERPVSLGLSSLGAERQAPLKELGGLGVERQVSLGHAWELPGEATGNTPMFFETMPGSMQESAVGSVEREPLWRRGTSKSAFYVEPPEKEFPFRRAPILSETPPGTAVYGQPGVVESLSYQLFTHGETASGSVFHGQQAEREPVVRRSVTLNDMLPRSPLWGEPTESSLRRASTLGAAGPGAAKYGEPADVEPVFPRVPTLMEVAAGILNGELGKEKPVSRPPLALSLTSPAIAPSGMLTDSSRLVSGTATGGSITGLSEAATGSVLSSEPNESEPLLRRASTLSEKLALCRDNLKALMEAEELRRQMKPKASHSG